MEPAAGFRVEGYHLVMAYFPLATEIGAIYTLVSSNGLWTAVFNDPTDANYVGMLTEVTGLDSADVRESAIDVVEGDGGVHGNFYMGRRPVVLTGKVFGHATLAARELRLDKLRNASLALRGDATLKWKPSDWATRTYVERFVPVRRQQPYRETGQWVKDFQVPLVSQYSQIFSTNLYTSASTAAGTGVVVENQGNFPAYPIIEITGISGATTTVTDGNGGTFKTLSSLTVASGEKVQFDMMTHQGTFTAGARVGQSATRYIDFASITQWPALIKGNNTVTLAIGAGGTFKVIWRDTWA